MPQRTRYQVLFTCDGKSEVENFIRKADAAARVKELKAEKGATNVNLWDTRDNQLSRSLGFFLR